jgi:hypothetical protein
MTKRWRFVTFAILAIVVLAMAFRYFWIEYEANQAELRLAHEMKVFALAYHEIAQGEGQLNVNEAGVVKIDWERRPGPDKLEDLAVVEASFPELAKRIRQRTFIVVWKARLLPTEEENGRVFLGYELGIEERGGWVLMANGLPKKVNAQDFRQLRPNPND